MMAMEVVEESEVEIEGLWMTNLSRGMAVTAVTKEKLRREEGELQVT